MPGPRPSRARPSSPARHHDSLRGYCRRRLQICDGPRGLLDEERVGGGGGVGLGGGHAVVPGVGGGAVHDGLMVGGPVVGGGGARQAVPAALVDVLHRDDGALSDLRWCGGGGGVSPDRAQQGGGGGGGGDAVMKFERCITVGGGVLPTVPHPPIVGTGPICGTLGGGGGGCYP